MADRYWVGGTATWDNTAGTKWSATNGGPGGASVPTTADDVFFTSMNTGTVTIGSTSGAKSINCSSFTGTLAGSTAITIAGSITLVTGMGFTYSGTITITATATLNLAGKTLGPLTINASGGSVTLLSALNIGSNALTITSGTFSTNTDSSFAITAGSISSSNSNTRAILLNNSTVTLSSGLTPINLATSTNLTFSAGTSTIICTNNGVTIAGGITGSTATGITFANVSLTGTTTTSLTHTIVGNNTFNNLSIAAVAGIAAIRNVVFDGNQIINGTLSTTGTAGNRRILFRSNYAGLNQTLTINSAPSLTDADFSNINVIGTAKPISGTRIGNLGGCRGITFSAPKTVYWNLAGSVNWSDNGWTDTPTGAPNTNFFPLAQDTATFTNSGAAGTIAFNSAITNISSIDMSQRTASMTLSLTFSITCFGDWKNGSGTTLSGSGTLTFYNNNINTITSANKTFPSQIVIDALGGKIELADALNIGTNNLTITNGTFDTKGFNVTAGTLSSGNSNVRTINLGSSTITLSSASPIILSTTTNLTFNAGTSQINVTSGSNPTAALGGLTFYNLSFTDTTAGSRSITGTNTNTFNNLSVTASSTNTITSLVLSGNQTITGTLTVAGASPIRRIFVRSDTLGTTRTLTVGTLSATDCDFRDITIAGTAAGSSPTRAGDCGGNSEITFPAAKTVYWNLAGAQDWSAIGWAPGSGGTPNINNFPLAQDTAVFNDSGAADTVSFDQDWNLSTINSSARTIAMTISWPLNRSVSIYGDFNFGSGVSTSSGTGTTLTFRKRGTQTITSNGKTFACNVTIDSISGTVILADPLVLSNALSRVLSIVSGTFDAATHNVTAFRVTNSSSSRKTLKMGSGTWTLSGTGTIWDFSTTTNLVFYKGTANIVLSDTSTSARTFAGGGLVYHKLTIGGTTGTSTLTISGNNQFAELASTKTVAHTIALGSTTQFFGKWTVTGTVGNVVTLTGTGTSHEIVGACTSGINYLAMGSIGFSSSSMGEFYAGANSTGTAGAPVYRTAKPADSTRYWVGGTGSWSETARWSTGSGGASGASVPRSHDDVVFNAASNATAYTATVNTVTGGIRMKSLTIAGPASGNVTLAGSTAIAGIHGNVTLPATGLTRTYTGNITLSGSSTGRTFTTNGVTLASTLIIAGVDCGWTLGSNLDIGASSILVAIGTFNCGGYNVTAGQIFSDYSSQRTINFNTGTITLSGGTPINLGAGEINFANLTTISSTSQINCSFSAGIDFWGGNQSFYNVAFTSTSSLSTITLNGVNSFNNLSFTGLVSSGLKNISLAANQTVTGTLTFSAGTDATMRHFVRSNTIGFARTITTAAFSGTDVDFRDITITGAAAPVSGTRLGNCKGNSGITFPAAKTVYWNLANGGQWGGSVGWATTSAGTPNINNFPLAQDTIIIENAGLNSGVNLTISSPYHIGTIDMSARTTSMNLQVNSDISVYGNWINGTGTNINSSSIIYFSGRNNQTITSAGKSISAGIEIQSVDGTLTLQDSITISATFLPLTINAGTFDANNFNVTLTTTSNSAGVSSTGTISKTVALGSGIWTIPCSGTAWNVFADITGTGTISLTSASAKTFNGQGRNFSNITLNQGGNGTLTILGNNTFKTISSTATGANQINIGTTTQTLTTSWTAAGTAGNTLDLLGFNFTSPGTLIFTGIGIAANVNYIRVAAIRAFNLNSTWYAGANSTNFGSLGWEFETYTAPSPSNGNFFLLY